MFTLSKGQVFEVNVLSEAIRFHWHAVLNVMACPFRVTSTKARLRSAERDPVACELFITAGHQLVANCIF